MRCRDKEIPLRKESTQHKLCKSCWVDVGRPWHQTSYDCTECRQTCFKLKGEAFKHAMCKKCFDTLREESLNDLIGPGEFQCEWEPRTIFMGNLPHEATEWQIANWVNHQVFNHPDPPVCEVRIEAGGRQGDHGGWKKVYKHFAFLKFTFARDALWFLDHFACGDPEFMGRRLSIYPCVIQGSWLYVRGQWHRCKDYIPLENIPGFSYAQGQFATPGDQEIPPHQWSLPQSTSQSIPP